VGRYGNRCPSRQRASARNCRSLGSPRNIYATASAMNPESVIPGANIAVNFPLD
jgi:hypothetical protein